MERSAVFSPCGRYRYVLRRHWQRSAAVVMVVGLNPSSADGQRDDATTRRCIRFAQDWGYGGLCMTNLFAFRARHPSTLLAAEEPVGPENDAWLRACAASSATVVAAWGRHGTEAGRDRAVMAFLPPLQVLRLGKTAQPMHPLYLPKSLTPVAWSAF
ncbi:MAG: DUF1643 domain-containing protein [Cyanobacteria bacterium]|nr:DUF1643 domain-containing protein [Cyanobacteria bacterium bin.51]